MTKEQQLKELMRRRNKLFNAHPVPLSFAVILKSINDKIKALQDDNNNN